MKPRVAILAVFFAALLWFPGGLNVSAAAKPITTTQMFDEFGAMGHCSATARLDNFAIALEQTPRATGYIVSYGPEGEGYGSGRYWFGILKGYLTDSRGISERRIKTVYGGRNPELHEPKIQLWIVPAGEPFPEPRKYETNIETFKGKFFEDEIEDYIDLTWEEEMGEGIGHSIDAAMADMMQVQKKAVAYIVAYNGEAAVPGSARRIAERQLERFKNHKVDTGRVKIIFGGVRKKTTLQLWVGAPGDPPPVADAGAEPLPIKNAQITSLPDVTVGVPQNERAVFDRLLEVMRAQPTVKIVAIVTLEGKQTDPEPDAEGTPVWTPPPSPPVPEPAESPTPEYEDHPPADLPQLVQKWRDELVNTHKIHPDRFVVLFATTEQLSGNYLDLWAVPPGQPLPDPNEEEEKSDETAEKIYENLPPSVTLTMGYRLGALIRDN